jgi:hypothetical protein
MNSNPLVERQREAENEYRRKKDFRYPFRICCVYMPEDGHDFPIFHEVKRYCDQNNLTFSGRPYDHETYEEDMSVKRTLAFHIYYKGYVQETQYYDTDPVHKIQVILWAYQDEEREKARKRQRRQERWDAMKETWNTIFTLDHFKRKPALDPEASQSKQRMRETDEKTKYPKSGGME